MTYFTADTTTIKDLFTLSAADISLSSLLICTACSLVIGAAVAAVFCRGQRTSRGYALTLALLPAIVQMVIMLVNGNIGTGVAVMGAFSLVRFRSAPGSAREICAIFLTMAALIYDKLGLAGGNDEKHLKITIPESLDYSGAFTDIFEKYTNTHELCSVKTTNMGSLFKLDYAIVLKAPSLEKTMIDELRTRNANLEIVCGREEAKSCDQL